MAINGTFNQIVKGSAKFGGTLVVFEGHPQLMVGGFNFALTDLPEPGVVLPCGTPVFCDEVNRTITPIITAKVKAIGTDTKVVTLEDNGFGATPVKAGQVLGIFPASVTTAATKYGTVASVDGNVITLSAAITDLAVGDVLVVVDGTTKKIAAVPNALTPYDIVRDADAVSVDGDGMIGNDRPILERRMPVVNDAIKTALQDAGCNFYWSNRK